MPIKFWNNIAVEAVAKRAGLDALKEEAERIAAASQRMVPMWNIVKYPHIPEGHERGTLKDSMVVEHTEDGSSITYGVRDEPYNYALIQHETPWFEHQYPHWQAYFLRVPFDQLTEDPLFFKRIQTAVRSRLRSVP